MTKEEAIERMEMLRQQYEGALLTTQAIDMAIEVLSADTVSREQYDYVCEEYNRLVHKAICIKTCYHAREHSAIEALEQEPVKCNYTCSDCVHLNKSYEEEPCHSCFNNDGAGYEPVKHGKPSKEAELFIDEANAYKREKGEQDDE